MSVKKIIQAAAGASGPSTYVEDVFSTYLYTGNGSTQTINNGIDLAGKGGLVWVKSRSGVRDHFLVDTARGGSQTLFSNHNSAQINSSASVATFTASGFATASSSAGLNSTSETFASWTFRKAPKFFDVVTYTGDGTGSGGRKINHNLGSVPGFIIIKATSTTGDWHVAARQSSGLYRIGDPASGSPFALNSTNAGLYQTSDIATTTQVNISLGMGVNASIPYTNASGASYVMYLFAHDAGGFGDAGDQSVVSCGSYAGTASGTFATVTLGWEPQFVITKRIDTTSDWITHDIMRGMSYTGYQDLGPNVSKAEETKTYPTVRPFPTGFYVGWGNNGSNGGATSTYIYLAIRRGPMKKPTSGTQVYDADAYSGSSTPSGSVITTGFPVDLNINKRTSLDQRPNWIDRLRGDWKELTSTSADAEYTPPAHYWPYLDEQNGIRIGVGQNDSGQNYINWAFRRAPGFFDVVCYRGNGSTQNVSHNLTVAPNLIIVKNRTTAGTDWYVYSSAFPTVSGNPPENLYLFLNGTGGIATTGAWNYTAPTASVFSVAGGNNESANNYVAYLFATLPGVSKVGSYTGTGTTQQINCGFTTGARFVLIRRTDFGTNNWFVWDTARGISASNDPYLRLNSTAAEVTNTGYINPLASGFEISSTAPAEINASGGSFIYLAIA